MHTTKGCWITQNLEFFFVMFLSYSDTYKEKKKKLKTFVFLVSWFPGSGKNLASSQAGLKTSHVIWAWKCRRLRLDQSLELTPPECLEPTPWSRHRTADTRWEGMLLALLLLLSSWKGARERKNALDRIKKKVSKEWMISLVHTHTPRCTNIYN